MAGKIKDITGQTFGELTVVRYSGDEMWECRCSCGVVKNISTTQLKSGTSMSCGHILRETGRKKVVNDDVFGIRGGTCAARIKAASEGRIKSKATSGVTGVYVIERQSDVVYQAKITFKGKYYNLGQYETLAEAASARKEAEKRLWADTIEEYEREHPKNS